MVEGKTVDQGQLAAEVYVAEKFSFKKADLKTSKWARKAHRNEPSAALDSTPDVPLRIQGTVDKRKGKDDDIGSIEVNGADQDPVPEQLSTIAPTYRIIVPSNRWSQKASIWGGTVRKRKRGRSTHEEGFKETQRTSDIQGRVAKVE
ncbi:hypothetical protein JR316_0012317 [Psilocybe cubensis]|uniref:Uncharacterized protein n=2 Tax=Psilocybe cubensis TaxID=181762 RepID=A0ACB8GHR9_PSICU|nr:hypothetical protein JR316_0012317 [Psilocybe cubensis]KAH9475206.1 hypothetical protein JR316_0012317 [Psilocybe cubensis]